MLKVACNLKWTIPLLAVVLLLVSSCSFIAPTPPPAPKLPATPPAPENQAPVINYITAQQQVAPASSSRIACVATDADGDNLTYAWSVDRGTITGNGDTITWLAPDTPGTYKISVTVTDNKGAQAKDSVTITAVLKPNHAPIATLIVREKGHPAITIPPETKPITVKRWSTTEIECQAEDPDGDPISFKWSATEGKIEGEGPKVQYIATTPGDFAITVTVIDSKGAQIKTSAYFHVPCCGAGG
jgi:hypothetical protein